VSCIQPVCKGEQALGQHIDHPQLIIVDRRGVRVGCDEETALPIDLGIEEGIADGDPEVSDL
jgi:hypothetical protein